MQLVLLHAESRKPKAECRLLRFTRAAA